MSYDFLFKIIFVGDTSVGKTALAERITKNEFTHHYDATIGVDFSTITMDIDDKLIKTHIWDTAGQECFSSIIATYYRGIAGAVIVFDDNLAMTSPLLTLVLKLIGSNNSSFFILNDEVLLLNEVQ